ncbi:DUF6069 family protein [Micromonospora sp. NPDC051141]|uniref:DUF6069 family protein n=1 Tax=Micromonospora sp. NPDC051141 TaxID=3364284 RepID=UPI0037A47BCD
MAPTSHRSTGPLAGRRRARGVAVAATVAVAAAVWMVATALFRVDLLVRDNDGGTRTVGLGAVAATSLIASVLGWALLAVLESRVRHARPIWTGAASVLLLLSLAGPLTAGATTASTVTLALLHLTVGAVLLTLLGRGVSAR